MRSLKLLLAAVAVAAHVVAPAAHGQAYPAKPIQLVVPSQPGGGLDVVARLFAAFVEPRLGQPVIVENKAGAQTLLGNKYVANAAPDGYHLLFTTPSTPFPALYKKPGIDVPEQLAFISMVLRAPQIVAVNARYGSLQDLAKASRGGKKLIFASYGSVLHLQSLLLNEALGIDARALRFSSSQDAAKAVAAGDADYLLASAATLKPWQKLGTLRPVAVTTNTRSDEMPELPSLKEAGVTAEDMTIWMGLYAPKGTPKAIVDRLNAEVRAFAADEKAAQTMRSLGFNPYPTTPEAFRAYYLAEQKSLVDAADKFGVERQ